MKTASIAYGAAALLGCVLSLNASAHALWLERGTPASKLYFGEYAENLRESSPGRLDSIVEPEAMIIDQAGTAKSATPSRENTHFSLPDSATVLVQARRQPIRESQGGASAPIQRRFLYARLGNGGSLPLDLQDSGNRLRLTFMGEPVPKAEIVVIAPSGWEKHLRTDEKGEASFSPPESGLYVVEAKHELNKPGEFEGKAYAVEGHKVTLSLYK
jgi:uncharacterized GH25 family protein